MEALRSVEARLVWRGVREVYRRLVQSDQDIVVMQPKRRCDGTSVFKNHQLREIWNPSPPPFPLPCFLLLPPSLDPPQNIPRIAPTQST